MRALQKLIRAARRLAFVGLTTLAIAVCPKAADAQQVNARIATMATNAVVWTNALTTVNSVTNLFNTFNYTHDLPVETIINSTNNVGTTAQVTNYFDLCMDNTLTNWTTTQPLTSTATCNGTTTVRSITVIPKSLFDGCYGIRLSKIGTGATNYINVTTRIGVTP